MVYKFMTQNPYTHKTKSKAKEQCFCHFNIFMSLYEKERIRSKCQGDNFPFGTLTILIVALKGMKVCTSFIMIVKFVHFASISYQ